MAYNPAAAPAALTGLTDFPANYSGAAGKLVAVNSTPDAVEFIVDNKLEKNTPIAIAVGDESTVLTTGTGKIKFRMPGAFTLTGVRASLGTAASAGTFTVDINESGTTVLSTKLTFDATETTTETATTPAVISDAAIADDAEMTIDIDDAGSAADAVGLKCYLIGTWD